MKLHFDNLHILHPHIQFLSQTTGLDDFFIVGGAVRDLLLGHKTTVIDVDLTMAGEPEVIWKQIEAKRPKSEKAKTDGLKVDIFRTEKFGTMTIVKPSLPQLLAGETIESPTKYEITPFREESGYSDMRHPDKIVWSSDLVLDAGRRDFTVNAMYYSQLKPIAKAKTVESDFDNEQLLKHLKDGFAIVGDILIIQNHEFIALLLPGGKLSESAYKTFCKKHSIDEGNISGIIRDPYLGIQDLLLGKIKCVGNPDRRFNEDALRILRAIRFVNTLNFHPHLEGDFDFEKHTRKSMQKNYFLVRQLSKERIHEEVVKVFSGYNPFAYVAILDELNLLKFIFPAIQAIKYLTQPVRYHPFDVYSHTLLALHHLQSINTNYLVRLAMLYHDTGKVEQYHSHSFGLTEDERPFIYGSWLNHVNCGPDLAHEDLSRIGFSNKEINEIKWYVANHMKPGEVLMSKPTSWIKKMREIYAEGGYEWTKNLLDICRGDRSGHYNPVQRPSIDQVNLLYDILDNLKNSEGQFTMNKMLIDGNQIMEHFQIKPGREIGKLMKQAYEWVMQDVASRNDKEKILKFLAKK